MRRILFLALLLLMACSPREQTPPQPDQPASNAVLKVFATREFQDSGLETAIIPDFERELNCRVELSIFPNLPELIRATKSDHSQADIVFGISSSFTASDSLLDFFLPYSSSHDDDLAPESLDRGSHRLLPYGFSHLCLIYDSSRIQSPPSSFGELQDARFLKSIALLDPQISGVARANIHWIVSVFGTSGYYQVLRALRKNVTAEYENPASALRSLQDGDSSLMMGLSTWPAWQKEVNPDAAGLDFVLFSEGSYLYKEYLGIHHLSQNPALAGAFVDYVLSPSAQKMIIYKLGLFPANRKTMLPPAFSDVPLSAWTTNDKIDPDLFFRDTHRWLANWERLLLP